MHLFQYPNNACIRIVRQIFPLASLATFFLLSGCVSSGVDKNYVLDEQGDVGLWMISYAWFVPDEELHAFGKRTGGPALYYRSLDENISRTLSVTGKASRPTRYAPDNSQAGAGEFYLIELPAGKYEIYGWRMMSGLAQDIRSDDSFSIRFEIAPGKITYTGEFVIELQQKAGIVLGLPQVVGAKIDIKDSLDRDKLILAKNYEFVSPEKIQVEVTTFESRNTETDYWVPVCVVPLCVVLGRSPMGESTNVTVEQNND